MSINTDYLILSSCRSSFINCGISVELNFNPSKKCIEPSLSGYYYGKGDDKNPTSITLHPNILYTNLTLENFHYVEINPDEFNSGAKFFYTNDCCFINSDEVKQAFFEYGTLIDL